MNHPTNKQHANNDKPLATKSPKASFNIKSWIWIAVKYLGLFLIIYTAINWWRQPVMPANPQLQLTDYQGKVVDLNQLSQESPVLVYFWGTWCPICEITSPKVNSLAQADTYPVVTVAIQSGFNSELDDYLQKNDFTFTTINDETGEIFAEWDGQVTPSYVIIKEGEMKQGLTGVQPEWSLKLRLWLASLI